MLETRQEVSEVKESGCCVECKKRITFSEGYYYLGKDMMYCVDCGDRIIDASGPVL